MKLPGKSFSTETWQQVIIPVKENEISVQIYWTESNIREHDPIRQGKDARSLLRPGIEEWGDAFVVKMEDLKAEAEFNPFESPLEGDDTKLYEIYYRLIMECDGANISVRWQFAKPGTEPYNGELQCSSSIDIRFAEM